MLDGLLSSPLLAAETPPTPMLVKLQSGLPAVDSPIPSAWPQNSPRLFGTALRPQCGVHTRMLHYFAGHGRRFPAQRDASYATPLIKDVFEVASLSLHLPLSRLTWQNSRSVPMVQDGWPEALIAGSEAQA